MGRPAQSTELNCVVLPYYKFKDSFFCLVVINYLMPRCVGESWLWGELQFSAFSQEYKHVIMVEEVTWCTLFKKKKRWPFFSYARKRTCCYSPAGHKLTPSGARWAARSISNWGSSSSAVVPLHPKALRDVPSKWTVQPPLITLSNSVVLKKQVPGRPESHCLGVHNFIYLFMYMYMYKPH